MPEFNPDILGRLADATPEELDAALSAIRADFAVFQSQPASSDGLTAVRALTEAAQAIRGEQTGRAQLASDFAAAIDQGMSDAAEPEVPDQPGVEVQETVNEQHDNPPDDSGDAPSDGDEGDSVQASSAPRGAPRRRIGQGAPAQPRPAARTIPRIVRRTTAAAGLRDFSAGQGLDREGLYRAFQSRLESIGSTVPGTDRYTVATVRSEYPEERMLHANVSHFANMTKVEAAVDRARSRHARDAIGQLVQVSSGPNGEHALTAAAGGLCDPLQALYDIRVVGDEGRPVRDALLRFGAERGGVQYRPAIGGVSQTGGIGTWTETQDQASPIVPKTCAEIECPGVVSAQVEAIYSCLTFSNMTTRFDPEFYDAVIRASGIAHDRIAENRLLTTITTASKDVYSAQTLGATRDILVTLDQITAYYRNVHRIAGEVPLRWIAPMWARNLMRADVTRQMVGDGLQALAITDAMIAAWLAERNINVTWHMDGIDPADFTDPTPDIVVPAQFYTTLADTSGVPVPGFPNAISTLLFADGDWLFLDGGTLDLGVVRDSTLNGQNRFQTFSESFEFPAFRGIETLHLAIAANPTGQSAATKDTSALVD